MQDLLNIANRQIQLELDNQLYTLEFEIKNVVSAAASEGWARSSRLVLAIDRVCADAIVKRGLAAWEILHRCVTTGRIDYSPNLSQALKDVVLPYINSVHGLTRRAIKEGEKMGLGQVLVRESERAQGVARMKIETEIDLFCVALSRASQAVPYQPHHVININGSNVGTVQTGAHSVATATLNSTSVEIASVRSALDELKTALGQKNENSSSLFLVAECEKELANPLPDKSRLRSLADAVKGCMTGTLDIASKIPDAIDGLQRAISLLP